MKQVEGKTDKLAYLNCLVRQLVIIIQALYFYNSTYFLFSLLHRANYYKSNPETLVPQFFLPAKVRSITFNCGFSPTIGFCGH